VLFIHIQEITVGKQCKGFVDFCYHWFDIVV